MLDFRKRISDPVHGIISLTEVELAVVDSRAFQRLRGVRQLGLAHYVFPGADYTRFAHSLGACHVMGRIMEALKSGGASIDAKMVQVHRLAALLHDVGHYPFSHATEHAMEDHYKDTLLTPPNAGAASPGTEATAAVDPQEPGFLNHELLGRDPPDQHQYQEGHDQQRDQPKGGEKSSSSRGSRCVYKPD